jgi:AcrR family transcriptional regulator
MTATAADVHPRDRLLNAADDLFYKEGIRSVGINRVLEEAQTPIMTLYRNFGSKDGLAAAYLERRGERRFEKFNTEVNRRASSPREKILATFDVLREELEQPDYRGCPFINATVEMASPDHEVSKIARHHKHVSRQWFLDLAVKAGVPDPTALALQLLMLWDGASMAPDVYGDTVAAVYARSAAETLVDAALAAGRTGGAAAASRPKRTRRTSTPSGNSPTG